MTLLSESPSGNASSDSEPLADTAEFDFSALNEAQVSGDQAESTDEISNAKRCPTCGDTIVREPGARGRGPKYHPQCRPSAATRVRDTVAGTGTRPRVADTRKAKEADEIIGFFKPKLATGCTMLMLADQYLGMVWMMAVPGICDNLRGILIANDAWRKQLLAARGNGSWLGLAFTLAVPIAATCARFGLLPQGRIMEIAKNLPLMLHKISVRMAEGNMAMDEMMRRVNAEAMKQHEKTNGGNGASNNGEQQPDDPQSPFLRNAA